MKYPDLILEDPAVYLGPATFPSWVVSWRVVDQNVNREVQRKRWFFFRSRADSFAGRLMHSAPHAPKVNRTPPEAYADSSIDRDSKMAQYYLLPQPNYYGATPLFMVMRKEPGTTTVLAERCYLTHSVGIVIALRLRQEQLDHERIVKNKGFPL